MTNQFLAALVLAALLQSPALSQDLACIKSETIKSWINTGKTEFSLHQYQAALNTFRLTQGFFPDKASVLDAQTIPANWLLRHGIREITLLQKKPSEQHIRNTNHSEQKDCAVQLRLKKGWTK